jgi:hypothetical protein
MPQFLFRHIRGVTMQIITTLESYREAIKIEKPRSDFDFNEEEIYTDHGWKARFEAVPKTRNVKKHLFVSNERFGFFEAQMTFGNWMQTEINYRKTFKESVKEFEPTSKIIEKRLDLLLIYCKPKNFSDYPKPIQEKWIHLGVFFCQDLFNTMKIAFDELEWRDWGPHWRSKYYSHMKHCHPEEYQKLRKETHLHPENGKP